MFSKANGVLRSNGNGISADDIRCRVFRNDIGTVRKNIDVHEELEELGP